MMHPCKPDRRHLSHLAFLTPASLPRSRQLTKAFKDSRHASPMTKSVSVFVAPPLCAPLRTRAQTSLLICTRSRLVATFIDSAQTSGPIYCTSSRRASQRLASEFLGSKMNAEGLTQRARQDVLAANQNVKKNLRSSHNTGKGGLKTLVIAVAVPLVAGILDAVINSPNSQWYKDLKKPWWNPPGVIFGLAWSVLYPLMGLASWLVWVEGGIQKQAYPLALYAIQLVLNLAWPALFFGAHNLPLALADIAVLVGVLALTVSAFKPANEVAANLLLPYVAWVAFATILTFNIWMNNRGGGDAAAHAD